MAEPKAHIHSFQVGLVCAGYPLPTWGADGKWGAETAGAMNAFRADTGWPAVPRPDQTTIHTLVLQIDPQCYRQATTNVMPSAAELNAAIDAYVREKQAEEAAGPPATTEPPLPDEGQWIPPAYAGAMEDKGGMPWWGWLLLAGAGAAVVGGGAWYYYKVYKPKKEKGGTLSSMALPAGSYGCDSCDEEQEGAGDDGPAFTWKTD